MAAHDNDKKPTVLARLRHFIAVVQILGRDVSWLLLVGFFGLLAPVGITWRDHWLEEQVMQSRSIGTLSAMTVQAVQGATVPVGLSQSLHSIMVVETAVAYYPLAAPTVVYKKAILTLELRGNGRQFLCDAVRVTCVATSALTLK